MEQVSIIVPVFNGEKYLGACLDSVLSQSFRDFRVYLIDDGSSDSTPEICRDYSALDGRICWIRQENRGVSAARNRGLGLAEGEFVTFCDGDDFWGKDHLETLVRAARETGGDMVSCNYDHVEEDGRFLRRTAFPAGIREMETDTETINYIRSVLDWETGWAVWARLFRRAAIENLRFCEEVGFGEDLLFVLEAACSCRRAVSISGGGYRYRQRAGSISDGTLRNPMLEARTVGAYWLWQWLEQLGTHRDEIAWEILRPGLEAIPAAQLPGALRKLPRREWILEIFRQTDSPLARFCIHENVLRYRIDRKWHSRGG